MQSYGRLFFLRDVRRVTLLFDSMGEMGFLTSRSPGGSFDRGLRPEAPIVLDRSGHQNRRDPRRSNTGASQKRSEITK